MMTNEIPKGFVKGIDISWSIRNGDGDNDGLFISKSIYDKRVKLLLSMENNYSDFCKKYKLEYIKNHKQYIRKKILNGELDDKRVELVNDYLIRNYGDDISEQTILEVRKRLNGDFDEKM